MPNYRKCVYTFGEVRLTEHPMGHALILVKKDGKAEFVHPMLLIWRQRCSYLEMKILLRPYLLVSTTIVRILLTF